MNKLKAWFSQKKNKLVAMSAMVGSAASLTLSAMAVETPPTFDLAAVMTTSVTTIVGNLLSMISAVLPITVTLLGASIGIAYAIKFIRRILGKS